MLRIPCQGQPHEQITEQEYEEDNGRATLDAAVDARLAR
jgi:hypothetical protein